MVKKNKKDSIKEIQNIFGDHKYKICVSGAADMSCCAPNIKELGEEVGREIVKQGCILLTGATTGVPYYAAKGAKLAGGVAVLKGTYEGRTTWFAVQHFGLPLSVCPQPDAILKTTIESSQNQINAIFEGLKFLEVEIKAMNPGRSRNYQEKVNQYNELVAQYNSLVEQTKVITDKYNNQVKSFNECVSGV